MDERTELHIRKQVKALLKEKINWVGEEKNIQSDLFGLTNDIIEIVIHSLNLHNKK